MKRLRSAKDRKVSSTRWLERQLDPYVRRARAEEYRSRAAYKLLKLDERLLKGVKSVVDTGIAPGGWSQVVRRKAPPGRRRWDRPAADRADRGRDDPPHGLYGRGCSGQAGSGRSAGRPTSCFRTPASRTRSATRRPITRTLALVEAGLEFALGVLRPGGAYVAKVLAGGAGNQLVAEMKPAFEREARQAARQPRSSGEWYVVAQGFRG